MDIYIKPVGKIQIVQKRNVLMKDVAELFIVKRHILGYN